MNLLKVAAYFIVGRINILKIIDCVYKSAIRKMNCVLLFTLRVLVSVIKTRHSILQELIAGFGAFGISQLLLHTPFILNYRSTSDFVIPCSSPG
jgi:hypothetical protein